MLNCKRDDGFTIMEIVIVIIITGILAGLFGQLLASAMKLYTDHNLRKNAHIDTRRAMENLFHDIREWQLWNASPTSTTINFSHSEKFKRTLLILTYFYYDKIHVAYNYSGGQMTYQRDDGNWNNQYLLIERGVNSGTSRFTEVTEGTIKRIRIEIDLTVNNKPLRMRTTIFPRCQGG